jgi:hypothetical protein
VKAVEFESASLRNEPGARAMVEGGMNMKTNYLVAIATVIALGEFASAFFSAQVFCPLKGLIGIINWKCISLGIWMRVLSSAIVALGSTAWDNRVAVFVVTHAAGWLVKFLSIVFAAII